MSKKTPVKQSPKPSAGTTKSRDTKDEAYATEKVYEYYNR